MYTPILKKYASYEFREYSLTCKKNREQGKKSKKLFFIILKYHISYYHIYNTEEVFFRVNKKDSRRFLLFVNLKDTFTCSSSAGMTDELDQLIFLAFQAAFITAFYFFFTNNLTTYNSFVLVSFYRR